MIEQIKKHLPREYKKSGTIDKYFEPFLGGGALFFWLSQNFYIKNAYLYEINSEIVRCYHIIQERIDSLIEELSVLEKRYHKFTEEEKRAFFYEKRDEYNSYIEKKRRSKPVTRVALLIFLNKTCYNGLYRVNSKGLFNVPFGKYKKPAICDTDNLYAVRETLSNAEVICGDFNSCLKHSDEDSFVYFDPPYRPISKTARFTSYAKKIFDDAEQIRLKMVFDELNMKKTKIMLSNSDPRNIDPDDHFFDELYAGYKIERLKASRAINSNAKKRGLIKEILVMNYR